MQFSCPHYQNRGHSNRKTFIDQLEKDPLHRVLYDGFPIWSFFFTCCFCFLDKTEVKGISSFSLSYSRMWRHNSKFCWMFGLLWVYSWTTKALSPWSSEVATCGTSDRGSFVFGLSISYTNYVSTGMDQTIREPRGELCCMSSCATNCWIGGSSLPEANETNSKDKLCTFSCATEDESIVVACEDRGTSSSSWKSGLNCSTIYIRMHVNVRYLGSQFQYRARGQGIVRDFFGYIFKKII